MARRKKKSGPPFVQLHHWLLASPAWQDLSSGARATYLELKRAYNGRNNGSIGMGARGAGKALGRSKSAAARYLRELESHGFITRTKPSSFNQKRLTVEWRLTEFRDDTTGEMASKLFASWTREHGLRGTTRLPQGADGKRPTASKVPDDGAGTAAKIQKPVPSVGSIVPSAGLSTSFVPKKGQLRPTGGTVADNSSDLQSHQWDTYTSTPECTPSEYIRNVAASIKVYLLAGHYLQSSEDDWWLMPLAAAVASKAQRDGKRGDVLVDPILSHIFLTFPGSTTSWDNHLLPSYLREVASEGLPLN